uniref:Uncharacterized protein n=1 Tax=Tanacetum cinerariifolium TaxID=118510 RepID=A0A6L2JZN2_TANCI|nr:hypothetical protein [Tanacetum cinerariifolium]
MKVKESINVTFEKTPTPSKTPPLEDDDLVEEEAIEAALAIAPELPLVLSPPISPYRRHKTVQGLRKTVRPQPPLLPFILARIDDWIAAYPSSPPPSSAHSDVRVDFIDLDSQEDDLIIVVDENEVEEEDEEIHATRHTENKDTSAP